MSAIDYNRALDDAIAIIERHIGPEKDENTKNLYNMRVGRVGSLRFVLAQIKDLRQAEVPTEEA